MNQAKKRRNKNNHTNHNSYTPLLDKVYITTKPVGVNQTSNEIED